MGLSSAHARAYIKRMTGQPRERGPPCAQCTISLSTHFMMPISARPGGYSEVYLPHVKGGERQGESND
jgi:hypothetical protein